MKFYNFLNESEYSKKLKKNEVFDILESKCVKNFKYALQENYLYRGDNLWNDNFYLLDKNDRGVRKSMTASNELVELVNLLKSWEKYPKRDKSIFCSTNLKEAWNFATEIYLIIPFDNTKLTIFPTFDFNFGKYLSEIEKFKKHIIDFDNALNSPFIFNSSFNDIKQIVRSFCIVFRLEVDELLKLSYKEIIELLNIKKYLNDIEKWIIMILNSMKSYLKRDNFILYDFLNKVLDPSLNNIKLENSLSNIKSYKNNEVWFDGCAVAIKYSEIKKLK